MRQSIVKQLTPYARQKLIIWLLVILPFVVLLSGITYLAVAQPGCAGCHGRDSDFAVATQSAPHSSVACVDCHVAPSTVDRYDFALREAFHMILPLVDGAGRDWAAVENERCLSCHETINTKVVTLNGIRTDHKSCATDAQCSDCHSSVAHGGVTSWVRGYDMETCLACHVSEASTECDVCHVTRDRDRRVSTGSFAVTHGKEWRKTHGMGNTATCTVCHTAAKCEKCHGAGLPHGKGFIDQHSEVSTSPAAKCTSCHEQRFCSDCHGLQMPHSKGFVRAHARRAEADPKLCRRCHAESDCVQCHVKHIHPGGAIGALGQSSPALGGE